MCYPCTNCNRCGKLNKDSVLYIAPPVPLCLDCGGELDPETGKCTQCGKQVMTPVGLKPQDIPLHTA